LPNRIRSERAQMRMSQEQLAALANVTRATVAAWENEETDIPASAVRIMCEHFKCTSDWLLGMSELRKPA